MRLLATLLFTIDPFHFLSFAAAMNLHFDAHRPQLPLSVVRPVVVVGKIIIDEYQAPQDGKAIISIGGGGPQAAWGAAAALAVLTTCTTTTQNTSSPSSSSMLDADNELMNQKPQQQPVMFLGPVGDLDWTDKEDAALLAMLGSAVKHVCPIRGPFLRTPRIRLWHDDNQNIQWHPLLNSFGEEGAQTLWNNRPSATDILDMLETSPFHNTESIICHAIMEAGTASPGEGNDAAAFLDAQLQRKIHFLGIEPVTFPEEGTGIIAAASAQTCIHRLGRFGSVLNTVSPDADLFHALESSAPFPHNWEFAVRNGPKGSCILPAKRDNFNDDRLLIPSATLETVDGKPVNPTGAGNAYAAAYTTCRGNGLSPFQAASIASAIGAVMCEHHHIPPWNNDILSRIQRAVGDVQTKAVANVQLSDGKL